MHDTEHHERPDRRARLLAWRRDWLPGLSFTGTVLAIIAYAASFTPSLLPRPWQLQGVITALSMLSVYWIGVLLAWIARAVARWAHLEYSVRDGARKVLTTLWVLALAALVVVVPAVSARWQTQNARRVGMPAQSFWGIVASVATTAVILLLLFALYRLVVGLNDWLAGLGWRRLPRPVAKIMAGAIIVVVTALLVDQLVLRPVVRLVRDNAASTNAQIPPGASVPSSPLRSGSEESAESWESLGAEGRTFVAAGPDADLLEQVNGQPALEPIRTYAGLAGDRELPDVRDAVVAEMHRTGAFERAAILIYTTTGTGWVNEWVASSFEYLMNGDSAIAAMQYSTLPSPIALLADTSSPREAATLMYEAVRAEIDALPENERPKLYLAGESLGSYGANSAFESPSDLLDSVDGALWTGTPGFTPLHRQLTEDRQGGSTEINPVIDNGRHYRFASNQDELTADEYGRALGPWEESRVVFLQHPDDPVVWWSMDLTFTQPDWLAEAGADDDREVLLTYFPLVTFWQVTADMTVATDIPSGHGHQYHAEVVPAWAGVLGRDPQADYSAIVEAIEASFE
ncbi:alpha/beta-hydrolase family protein [Blastococcus sp. Marseille-P5729]|uniref:alpha/beta hydrolase n=1 Tax=Blastococcus sp. Marseille-P5729 TaxID=2086582 RepID=UPI000D10057E|nr:alpha/beta hydrolase [Blastococcus sp. Marseille-P5729]